MATFVKLTTPKSGPTWVNLDLVRYMNRLPAYEGDRYSDQNDAGEWVDSIIGAKPERTHLTFGPTVHEQEDFAEVLESPDEILDAADDVETRRRQS